MGSSIKYFIFLLWVGAVYFIGIGIFTSGFLLRRQVWTFRMITMEYGIQYRYFILAHCMNRCYPIEPNVEMHKVVTNHPQSSKRQSFY